MKFKSMLLVPYINDRFKCFKTYKIVVRLPYRLPNVISEASQKIMQIMYSETCVRKPPLKWTLVVDVERWLSYKGTCHVILLAKLHYIYLYKTDNFFHINHYLKSVSGQRWLSYTGFTVNQIKSGP